jgi:hypothetical protein
VASLYEVKIILELVIHFTIVNWWSGKNKYIKENNKKKKKKKT